MDDVKKQKLLAIIVIISVLLVFALIATQFFLGLIVGFVACLLSWPKTKTFIDLLTRNKEDERIKELEDENRKLREQKP